MGTMKQAEALIKTARRAGKVFTETQAEQARTEILAMDNKTIQEKFAQYNNVTGFDRKKSMVTDAQLLALGRREVRIYGQAKPVKEKTHLTFEEADAKIKTYDAILAMEVDAS